MWACLSAFRGAEPQQQHTLKWANLPTAACDSVCFLDKVSKNTKLYRQLLHTHNVQPALETLSHSRLFESQLPAVQPPALCPSPWGQVTHGEPGVPLLAQLHSSCCRRRLLPPVTLHCCRRQPPLLLPLWCGLPSRSMHTRCCLQPC